LPQVEVFEVASFHHHFDVVREDAAGQVLAAPRLTVRLCDGLSCELAGAQALLDTLSGLLGADVRVIPASCVGRCEQAPAVAVHQHALAKATPASVLKAVQAGHRC
jgi:formate dehydrogenase beta subunit